MAAEDSLVQMDNTLVWMSTSHQKGFQVMAMSGQSPQLFLINILKGLLITVTLTSAYAFSIKTSGHSLYVLTLRDLGYTLVYDFAQNGWTYWTSTENNVEGYFKGQFTPSIKTWIYSNMRLMARSMSLTQIPIKMMVILLPY